MRKLIAVILAVMMCVSLFACSEQPATTTAGTTPATTTTPAAPAALTEDFVILYTNDIHTYIDNELNYAVLAGVKAELEKTYGTVILADAGDHIQGTAFGSMDKGETIIKLMNAAGYDVATLGNHEFDYGMKAASRSPMNGPSSPTFPQTSTMRAMACVARMF